MLLPGEVNPTDRQTKSADAHTGDNAFHFWHANEVAFQVEQAVEIPGSGTWTASAFLQGGDVGPEAEIYFYVRRGEELLRSEDIALEGWVKWKEPRLTFTTTGAEVVTIGVSVRCAPGGWGTIDDVTLLAGE